VAVANPYPQVKAAIIQEFDRLNAYLRQLDPTGWEEQSYCADWLVYQAVSHVGSGSRIGKLRLDAWVNGGQPASREIMMEVWGLFDSLGPQEMQHEYMKAAGEYLAAVRSIPDEAGLVEVEGFRGKQPLYVYEMMRLWELALHAWDVYVARDHDAKLGPAAVELLSANLQNMGATVDAGRAAEFKDKPAQIDVAGTSYSYTLDLSGERPRLQAGKAGGAAIVVEAPAEEIVRFVSGRQWVPGGKPQLKATKGSTDDLSKLKRAFR
jgi:uncharacterized protein (TIGR03083 family)